MKKEEKTFESSLKELEGIVHGLEEGDLPLEESLALFEQGIKLSRECQTRLKQAERRIEVLLQDEDGNPELQPIEVDDLREQKQSNITKRVVFDDED